MKNLCNLQKVKLFTQKINQIDPGAIIIFQGDHGWKLDPKVSFEKFYISKDQFKIFNAIMLPNRCNLDDVEKFMVNLIDNISNVISKQK